MNRNNFSFSLGRLGDLLLLDMKFSYRFLLRVLIASVLITLVGILVPLLGEWLLVRHYPAFRWESVHSITFICLCVVSGMVMSHYNSRIHTSISPLFLQLPSSTLEKLVSLLLPVFLLPLMAGVVSFGVGCLYGFVVYLLGYGEPYVGSTLVRGAFYLVEDLFEPWTLWAVLGFSVLQLGLYLYSIISPRRSGLPVLYYLGLNLILLCTFAWLFHILFSSGVLLSIDMSEDGYYLIFERTDSYVHLSVFLFLVIPYLLGALFFYLSYRSLHRKQVK